jgi:sensor domain CHASE-containing protein
MHKILLAITAFLFLGVSAQSQQKRLWTEQERSFLIQQLEITKTQLEEEVQSLTAKQVHIY